MEQPKDRRKARSRRYLTEALVNLMAAKKIEEISVRDLVEEAQVARSTFYSQFEDKPHFIRAVIEEMLENLREKTRPDSAGRESACFDKGESRKYYIKHFEYIARNAAFFKAMLSGSGTSFFREKLEESAWITYEAILSSFSDEDLPVPKKYLIRYTISAHIGLTAQWLQEGMKYSPAYMAELLTELTFQGVFHGLGIDKLVELPK